MKSNLKILLIQIFVFSVLTELPTPNPAIAIGFNQNNSILQIKADNIPDATQYLFTYSNEIGFSKTITSNTNIVNIPCGNQACNQISVSYSYKTNSDSSENSQISKMYCGSLPGAPSVKPKLVWNSNNYIGFNFVEPSDKGGISISGYRLYMKQASDSDFRLVFDGNNQPYTNYAFISNYLGKSLTNILYDFAYTVLNGVGESGKSPILTILPNSLPNLDYTKVTGTALQSFQSNSDAYLTISPYDDKKMPIISEGVYFMSEITNYCIKNQNNPYQCDRVPKTDPNYTPDLLGLPINQIFTYSNSQYTTKIRLSSPGWITLSTYYISLGGLRGQYFSNVELKNPPTQTQIDSTINISGSKFLSVRWTGGIFSPTTEFFKIYANYGDGIRIWINNNLMLDRWDNCCEGIFQILLTANSFNNIKIESKSKEGLDSVVLKWESDSIPYQIIPSTFLFNYNVVDNISYKGIQVTKGKVNDYDVIIIGGGISGIASAMKLQEKNLNYVILEARKRTGGRMWTESFGNKKVNLGASFIHGASEKNPIFQFASKYNLEFKKENKGETITYYNNNNQIVSYKPETLRKYYKNTIKITGNTYQERLLKSKQCKLKEDFSVQDAIDLAIEADPELITLLDKDKSNKYFWNLMQWADEQDESVEFNNDSLLRWGKKSAFPGPDLELELGYGTLIEKIIPGLKINLETEVKSIENYDTNSINIVTNNGNFTTSKVIITVSLGVLKNNQIKFVPELPDFKKDAIKRLQMGTLNKVYIQFEQSFWEDDLATLQYFTSQKGEFPWTDVYSKPDRILLFWLSGKFAEKMEELQDTEIINKIMTILESIYENKVGKFVNYKITRWGKDQYSRGSYSSFTKGSKKSDNDALGKSVQNLHFCGEATDKDQLGTVHGAYLSGVRAANEIFVTSQNPSPVIPDKPGSKSSSFYFSSSFIGISLVLLNIFL